MNEPNAHQMKRATMLRKDSFIEVIGPDEYPMITGPGHMKLQKQCVQKLVQKVDTNSEKKLTQVKESVSQCKFQHCALFP
jgi:hypothetical protein